MVRVGLLPPGSAAAAVVVGELPAGIVELEVEGVHLETVEVDHLGTVEVVHLGTVLVGVLVLGIVLAGVLVLGTVLAGVLVLGIGLEPVAVGTVLAGVEVEGGLPGIGPVEPRLVDTAEG